MKRFHALPSGAELDAAGNTRFRVWAPDATRVSVIADVLGIEQRANLLRTDDGWHEVTLEGVGAGSLYRLRIDDEVDVPDPASRFNPQGVNGPCEVVDPRAFEWQDEAWRGRAWHEAVIYELHVGTFTQEGTYAAIIPRLQALADIGVTCIELLPVATFPGDRGWGYDGVLPYAPHPAYGRPEDLKQLIQAAHAVGLTMILDVVYNHFGPAGNYLHRYASGFFTDRHHTPWGAAINFEGATGRNVRDFFIHNALYWLEEFHFDGLRLDAIHAIKDDSPQHFVDELADALEAGPGRDRYVHLILENHHNEARRLQTRSSSKLSKAQWNDDSHHALHVLVSGESDGYYIDYAAKPLEQLGRILAEGFAYQGEPSLFAGNERRGEISRELPPTAFINFLQNHDQIGNRAMGERLAELAGTPQLRAAMTLLLLSPSIPMLFMGEEYAAPQPFLYFCEYQGELADAITNGRRGEFAQFRAFASEAARASIPDPNAVDTFTRSRLQWSQRDESTHSRWLQLTQELLRTRRDSIVPLIPLIVAGLGQSDVTGELLTVHWPLSDGRALALRANLSETTRPVPALDTALIYPVVTDATSDNTIGAWEVQLWVN